VGDVLRLPLRRQAVLGQQLWSRTTLLPMLAIALHDRMVAMARTNPAMLVILHVIAMSVPLRP